MLGATSDDALCRAVPEGKVDAARDAVAKAKQTAEPAGGLSAITFAEDPARRMGSEHVVVGSGADGAPVLEFAVVEEGGSFVVAPGVVPTAR
jgi:hypothetical protein